VRIFPAEIARGSKVFALGWSDTLTSNNYADDDSRYVELHGGLAPTFNDQVRLLPNQSITWQERWYPVHGMGDLTFANAVGALAVQQDDTGLHISFYPTQPVQGTLIVYVDEQEQARQPIQLQPGASFGTLIRMNKQSPGKLSIQIEDIAGRLLFTYTAKN